jgi:iron complex outermembrane receptor protein
MIKNNGISLGVFKGLIMSECSSRFSFGLPLVVRKTAILTIAVAAVVQEVQAAAVNESAGALEEVIVTATKTGAKDVQSIPLSVTAIGEEALKDSQIKTVADLAVLAPGVSISRNSLGGQLYIRGIGTNYIFVGGDPSSTIHLDGVYLSRPTSVFNDLLELERIEVLRGPQGTLYGRNSTGGTINLITRKPSHEFEADVLVDLGSYNKRKVSGYVSGGLVDGLLAANVAINTNKRDGYVDNKGPGGPDKLNDQDTESVRLGFDITPTEDLQILVSADYSERDQTAPAYKPSLRIDDGTMVHANPAGDIPPPAPFPALPDGIKADVINDPWAVSLNSDSFWRDRNTGLNTTVNWALSDSLKLTSVTGYRESIADTSHDTDNTELGFLRTDYAEDTNQFSQELQLLFQSDNLSWVSGLYYLKEDAHTLTVVNNGGFTGYVSPLPAVTIDATSVTTSTAIFTDMTLSISRQLSVLAGARYSDEEKTFAGSILGPGPAEKYPSELEDTSSFSPRMGVQYNISDAMMAYTTLSKGFKSGGFNFTDSQHFDKEEVTAFEIGHKMDLASIRSQINSSVFYYDYTDLQLNQFISPGVVSVVNAPEADILGLEVETQTLLTDNWRLSSSFAYLDATYGHFITKDRAGAEVDVSGNTLSSAPEYSVNLVSDIDFAVQSGAINLRLEYHWQDRVYFTQFNNIETQASYGLVNASLGYVDASEVWQARAYVRNLGDKAYTNSSQSFSTVTGVGFAITEPRTFGVEMRYKFK